IAFAVTSMPDSKTILDQGGAENLLGKGDMLYSPQSFPDPKRVQGAYISTDEVTAVVEYIKQNNDAYFDEELIKDVVGKEEPKVEMAMEDLEDEKNKFDPLLPEALKLAIETGQASISMIQRRFAVGYAKAARIIDQMEQATFISPHDGSRARRVFATMDDFNLLFPDHADR
ncbi:MAG: DNA translocase FtsK, partial [Firmicutes bacterium]|nr:DNA translocase FtsK [Bacillota bacterium]